MAKKNAKLTPYCAFRECLIFGHLSHFGNRKHQVIEIDVAVTPLQISVPLIHIHTRAI